MQSDRISLTEKGTNAALQAKLEELKAQRLKEFEEKQICQKAVLVAEYLGRETGGRFPPKYLYENLGLTIFYDGYGSYLSVSFKDQYVVSHTGTFGASLYHPFQPWEDILNEQYLKAKALCEKRERWSKEDSLRIELAKWE